MESITFSFRKENQSRLFLVKQHTIYRRIIFIILVYGNFTQSGKSMKNFFSQRCYTFRNCQLCHKFLWNNKINGHHLISVDGRWNIYNCFRTIISGNAYSTHFSVWIRLFFRIWVHIWIYDNFFIITNRWIWLRIYWWEFRTYSLLIHHFPIFIYIGIGIISGSYCMGFHRNRHSQHYTESQYCPDYIFF